MNTIGITKEAYLENEYAEYWIENGVLFLVYKRRLIMTLDVAKKIVEDRLKVSNGVSRPMFLDARNFLSTNRETMKYYKTKEVVQFVTAGAGLLGSYLGWLAGSIFIALEKPLVPTKLFTDEKKALKWLEKYKSSYPGIYLGKQTKPNTLNEILAPYAEHWEEWTVSIFCNLTQTEVAAVNYYKKYLSNTSTLPEHDLSYSVLYSNYTDALKKLKFTSTQRNLDKWNRSKHLPPREQFLNAPITGLISLLPTRACFRLSSLGASIGEILEKHTVHDIHAVRGMGKKGIEELKNILKNYNCQSLLKE